MFRKVRVLKDCGSGYNDHRVLVFYKKPSLKNLNTRGSFDAKGGVIFVEYFTSKRFITGIRLRGVMDNLSLKVIIHWTYKTFVKGVFGRFLKKKHKISLRMISAVFGGIYDKLSGAKNLRVDDQISSVIFERYDHKSIFGYFSFLNRKKKRLRSLKRSYRKKVLRGQNRFWFQ